MPHTAMEECFLSKQVDGLCSCCWIMILKFLLCLQLIMVSFASGQTSFDPFMDNELFSIKWSGPLDLNTQEVESLGERHVMITTNHQEQYRCILPESMASQEDALSQYTGPTAEELLQPLFSATHCSYRIETYWTYELCHGKHLKQYHESKDQGTPPKTQEYYLGFGNHRNKIKKQGTDGSDKVEDTASSPSSSLPTRELDGLALPYYEVIMGDGTTCDLTGTPRQSHVLYVCQPEGRGEVYELKESSTCQYEVVVLTSSLCSHPAYRAKTDPVSEIRCHAMLGSPNKPSQLYKVENEVKYQQNIVASQDIFSQHQVPPSDTPPKVHRKKPTSDPPEEEVRASGERGQGMEASPPTTPTPPRTFPHQQPTLGTLTDKQTLRDIFSGRQCLSGGTGWWKHEVCFGKHAKQYHIEKSVESKIYLGYWDRDKHLAWLKDNPGKRPRAPDTRKWVSLLYSDGEVCDLTGKPRSCEVRIKCLSNMKNTHAVLLSLSEPESCQYVLTVESALFCSVVKEADEDGLFDHVVL